MLYFSVFVFYIIAIDTVFAVKSGRVAKLKIIKRRTLYSWL